MTWFAPPTSVAAALARPVAAALAAAAAVTGVATWADGWRQSNADFQIAAQHRVETFDADYRLGRDADGSARLTVTERIGLVFPEPTQQDETPAVGDPGFVRVIPTRADGRSTPVQVIGVEDGQGRSVAWNAEPLDDALRLEVTDGEPGALNTYVVRYSVDNVVHTDGDGQLLRWDVNGSSWSRSIKQVNAALTVEPAAAAALEGPVTCAAGAEGDQTTCPVEQTASGEAPTMTATGTDLAPHETVTIEAGFEPDSFTEPPADERLTAARAATLGIGALALALAGGGAAFAATRRQRALGGHVAVAQSVIPRDLSPALAGSLYGSPGRGIVGQLLDAAIKGNVRLRPGDEDVLVELVSWPRELSPEAELALSVLVPRTPTPPQSLRGRLDLASDLTLARVRDCALRAGLVDRPDTRRTDRLLAVAGGAAAVGIPWFAHTTGVGFVTGATALVAALGSVGVGYGIAHAWQSWTPRGTETLGYLEGVKHYLVSPQTERIAFLQAAAADGHRVTAAEEADVYEQLLPYAAVLGVEDTWLAMADSTGVVERPWLPEGRLGEVFDAVRASDLAARLDGRIDPLPGSSVAPRATRYEGQRPNLASGPAGGGTGGS